MLTRCNRCRRHVRVADAFCPFCAAMVATASATVLAACTTHRTAPAYGGPPAHEEDVVRFERTLEQDQPELLDTFADRAANAQCTVTAHDPQRVIANCQGIAIAMLKTGVEVTIECKGVSLDECKTLFQRIVEPKATTTESN